MELTHHQYGEYEYYWEENERSIYVKTEGDEVHVWIDGVHANDLEGREGMLAVAIQKTVPHLKKTEEDALYESMNLANKPHNQ